MTRRTLPTDPPVDITLRRSARSRRFSLRVSQVDGLVTLSMPARAREDEALAFAAGQAAWLHRALARSAAGTRVAFGSSVPVEGRMLTLTIGPVRAARIEGDCLVLPPDAARAAARAQAFLRLLARQRLQAATEHYAAKLDRPFRRITLRDTRSRWGSCAPDGSLMYSWRLVMAPPEVLAYVAAHEVAHLAEMNHSPAFWAVVARLMPDYARHRRWLKTQGAALQAIRFAG
jgi:predicted metal-dependent hydrolase